MNRRHRSGSKTPQWKIDAMRQMYADGGKKSVIAQHLGVSRAVVRNYCRDIDRPQTKPLTGEERHRLLVNWR